MLPANQRDSKRRSGCYPRDELRAQVRHACDLATAWRFLSSRDAQFIPAEVRDLSHRGIGLIMPEPFRRRTILVLQLEGQAGLADRAMLVRINHITKLADQRWLVGCSFAKPLSEEELRALLYPNQVSLVPEEPVAAASRSGTRSTNVNGHDRGAEKRVEARRIGMSVPVCLGAIHGSGQVADGEVVDRSASGIGLLVSRSFFPGTILRVRGRYCADDIPWVHVRVMRSKPKGKLWQLGCQFIDTPAHHIRLMLG